MKLLDYFKLFLTDTVNLNQSRLDDLDSRVDAITSALKAASNLDGHVLDTVPQGSWAHRTIIRPAAGLEFDADFLIQLSEAQAWNLNPTQYTDAVWTALSSHGTYASMITRKNRCVRVTYANDCHIDVVPYVILSTGREVIINRTTNEFEDTNPVGFTEWLQGKDDLTGGALRQVLRLLKYLRDHCDAFKIKSVLLTTLVGNVTETWRTYDPAYYQDVPTTLVHLVKDLDAWLQVRPTKPSIADPSCPSTTFDHRWTDNQYSTFSDKVHELAPKIQAAFDVSTPAASVLAWQAVFGSAFPATLAAATAVEATRSVTKAITVADRAPNERFIEEMFPVSLTHNVGIVCEMSEPSYRNRPGRRRALHTRRGRAPKERSLLFKVVKKNVQEPFDVYWKVRNHGSEAAQLGQLRGQIYPDEGQRQRSETTRYTGHHYVECYIVKDGVCVARAHEPVIID